MNEIGAKFVHRNEHPDLSKMVSDLHEYFEINQISTRDAVSGMSNLLISFFLANYSKQQFLDFLYFLAKSHDLNMKES